MNQYFIFKNINSKDMGIIIDSSPVFTRAPKKIEEIKLDGKNGSLYIDDNLFDTMIRQLSCVIVDKKKDIREIMAWLSGEGPIIFSTELDKYYEAAIINQIDYTDIARQLYTFPLQIELQPFAYSVEEKKLDIKNHGIFNIEKSTYTIFPRIKVYGNGDIDLNINGRIQKLYNINEYVELDSKLEIAYKDLQNKNMDIAGTYLTLEKGNNSIEWTGIVSKVEIYYRECYI